MAVFSSPLHSLAVQNTTNQSSSPKVLLYGSRYTSLIVVVLKDASETFMFKRNILLFDSILFLDFRNYVLYLYIHGAHCSRMTGNKILLPMAFFNFPHSYMMGTIKICKKILILTENFWKIEKFVQSEKFSWLFLE